MAREFDAELTIQNLIFLLQKSLRDRESRLAQQEMTSAEDARMIEERGTAWTTREKESRRVSFCCPPCSLLVRAAATVAHAAFHNRI